MHCTLRAEGGKQTRDRSIERDIDRESSTSPGKSRILLGCVKRKWCEEASSLAAVSHEPDMLGAGPDGDHCN